MLTETGNHCCGVHICLCQAVSSGQPTPGCWMQSRRPGHPGTQQQEQQQAEAQLGTCGMLTREARRMRVSKDSLLTCL